MPQISRTRNRRKEKPPLTILNGACRPTNVFMTAIKHKAMTEKAHLIAAISKAKLIFVLPEEDADTTTVRIRALIGEGKGTFSIATHRPKSADRIAAAVSAENGNALIGATGVTDSDTAREAILSGADFISTPYLDSDTVRICHRYGKVCIPGALSVTEVLRAIESGCDLVGVCPAQLFGPKLLQAIKGPIPQANLVPSGTISESEAWKWIQAGAAAVEVELAKG